MIIFYNKTTGIIEGTIDGRIHNEQQLNMWVGDKNETERLVIQWKIHKWFNQEGEEVDEHDVDAEVQGYFPDHPQAELLADMENRKTTIYQYKIDLKTKQLVQI